MALTDMPLEELRRYRPEVPEPPDLDDFWAGTLKAARGAADAPAIYEPVTDPAPATVELFDVRFPGWGGQPVAAWLVMPRGVPRPLPVVVTYIGYGGGRGLSTEHLFWSAMGYAQLVVDTRGQGHDTPDPDPVPFPQLTYGFMTRGIEHRDHYFYRRAMTDCVRAVDAVREHPDIDPERVIVSGISQGGGLALATAGLARDTVAAALIDVPFLCHYRRSAEIASEGPYPELVRYLGRHRRVDPAVVFDVLNHFDGLHFAARATAPALFSVGLMDPVCPPSTVFAAYNRWAGERSDITVWEFGDHAGGWASQPVEQVRWLAERGLSGAR
ncbi:acetylxylan esterase [Streptomyces calidiresistens]|uniref:Prolyl oligopeptidase family serine peptidase n=1 Tax=Streptomyces calidiresistens TaxID=1485586 RepID=A0A7W3T811_9ACTN|nr:acetylxylan esterase [Streptomyces calidiresistens]MBB0232638.1 prolyl oligopeptidase family serine peptidase [Streptomyces calidiresistens]